GRVVDLQGGAILQDDIVRARHGSEAVDGQRRLRQDGRRAGMLAAVGEVDGRGIDVEATAEGVGGVQIQGAGADLVEGGADGRAGRVGENALQSQRGAGGSADADLRGAE